MKQIPALLIGFEVQFNDLFDVIGPIKQCSKSHEYADDCSYNFCPRDGKKIEFFSKKTIKKPIKNILDKANIDLNSSFFGDPISNIRLLPLVPALDPKNYYFDAYVDINKKSFITPMCIGIILVQDLNLSSKSLSLDKTFFQCNLACFSFLEFKTIVKYNVNLNSLAGDLNISEASVKLWPIILEKY